MTQVLANVTRESGQVQASFFEFLLSLGWPVDTRTHPGWCANQRLSWKLKGSANGRSGVIYFEGVMQFRAEQSICSEYLRAVAFQPSLAVYPWAKKRLKSSYLYFIFFTLTSLNVCFNHLPISTLGQHLMPFAKCWRLRHSDDGNVIFILLKFKPLHASLASQGRANQPPIPTESIDLNGKPPSVFNGDPYILYYADALTEVAFVVPGLKGPVPEQQPPVLLLSESAKERPDLSLDLQAAQNFSSVSQVSCCGAERPSADAESCVLVLVLDNVSWRFSASLRSTYCPKSSLSQCFSTFHGSWPPFIDTQHPCPSCSANEKRTFVFKQRSARGSQKDPQGSG